MFSFMLVHISWIMIVVAAVLGLLVGTLWYSPFLFGDRWARLVGIQMDKNIDMKRVMLGAFGVSLAHAYGIAWILERAHALDLFSAVMVTLLVAVLFVGSNMVSGILWERRSPELVLINFGSTVACYLAMALLFVYTAV